MTMPRKPVDKTVKFSRGSARFSSGNNNWTTWEGKFLFRADGDHAGYWCLLTAKQARALAAELIRRAEYQEAAG